MTTYLQRVDQRMREGEPMGMRIGLTEQVAKHKDKIDLTMDQEVWLDELIELSVDREMAYFEMLYHRDGKQKYSWSRDDMSEESIAALPDWWFDGTRAKRQLRKIRGN